MPKRLNVDWPAVRVLAVALGVREAAGQYGNQRGRGTTTLQTRSLDGFP